MTNFYIGDTHWGHENGMAFDNRPFKTVEENDKALIECHNEIVNVDDDVYFLGDLSWYNVTKTIDILKELNGNKHLIIGNHDERFMKNRLFRDCFVETVHYKKLDIGNGKHLILSHYPILCFDGQFRGNYHFYAHVHNTEQWNMIEHFKKMQIDSRGDNTCNMFNVGCMMKWMNYTPRTFEQVVEFAKRL